MGAPRIVGGLIMTLMLAACASDQGPMASQSGMTDRWDLSAPNAPPCGMNFDGETAASQGTVVPDGGCPGEMYRSRTWVLANDTLTINDGESQPLATFKRAPVGFQGVSSAGAPVTLTR